MSFWMSMNLKLQIKGVILWCRRSHGHTPHASTNGRTSLPVTSLFLQQTRVAIGACTGHGLGCIP